MAQPVSNELDHLEAKIDHGIRRARRSATITLVVSILIIAALCVYFFILTGLVRQVMEPTAVAQYAGVQIQEQLPMVRDQVLVMAEAEAPGIADTLITQALNEGVPQLRQAAQENLQATVVEQLDLLQRDFIETAQATLRDDQMVREAAAQLQTDQGQIAFEEALYARIEEEINADPALNDLIEYEAALEEIDGRLRSLAESGHIGHIPEENRQLFELVAILRELSRRMPSEGLELPQLQAPATGIEVSETVMAEEAS